MIPLETSQLLLKWLYAFPSDDLAPKWKRIAYFMFASIVIFVLVLAVISGSFYIFEFILIDVEGAIFALFHTLGLFNMLYQSIMIVVLRNKLNEIFKSLSKIYNESKCFYFVLFFFIFIHQHFKFIQFNMYILSEGKDLYPILVDTNKQCEWIWSLFIEYIMKAVFVIAITMSVVSVLFCYIFNGYFNVNHAYHMLKFM